ncbi:hypothetical protein KKC04_04170 [Patescibacteria group bacterium]|nr:hypothetical protein [Patescibacteria group bacterium]
MIKNKQHLIDLLCACLRNFIVCHLGIKQLEQNPKLPKKVTFGTKVQKVSISLEKFLTDKNTGETISSKELFNNCKKSQSRAVLSETYELIKLYCEKSSQIERLKNWTYYNFIRVVRHTTSHGTGGTLNKWPPELSKKGITSVSWKNKIIDKSMLEKPISMTDPEIFQLIFDELDFVKNNLD